MLNNYIYKLIVLLWVYVSAQIKPMFFSTNMMMMMRLIGLILVLLIINLYLISSYLIKISHTPNMFVRGISELKIP